MTKKSINRINKFFNEKDFIYQKKLGREYTGGVMNFKIILYRVNIIESKTHNLYGESKSEDKKFFPPVELTVSSLKLGESEEDYFSDDGIVRDDISELTFSVYDDEISEKNCEINRGDFLLYFDGKIDRYFIVTKANNVQDSSETIGGYAPFYRKITAMPSKSNVIKNLNNE